MTLDNQIERLALGNLLEAAKAFYSQPNNKQAFEAWEKEKLKDADHCNLRLLRGVHEVRQSE